MLVQDGNDKEDSTHSFHLSRSNVGSSLADLVRPLDEGEASLPYVKEQ